MDAIFLFLLKSTLLSGLLYAWYLLALKDRRLHRYNRFFLLFILYASIQVPLLDLKWSPAYQEAPVIFASAEMLLHTLDGTADVQPVSRQQFAAEIDYKTIALGLAALVSLALLAAMLLRIARIVRIGRRYSLTSMNGIPMLQTDLPDAPFSFMNRIFWRAGLSPETEIGRMILRHEQAHVKQGHTYDKIASQFLSSIFWMNPVYWLIQKELNMVHEFLADEQGIVKAGDGMQEEEYGEALAKMLLQAHSRAGLLSPEHRFFSSPIKRRLTMLQTTKKVRASALRRAAVLPLIAGSVLIFAFSPREAPRNAAARDNKKIVLVVDAGHGGKDAGCRSGALVEKELNLKVAKRLKELAPRYNIEVHLTRKDDRDLSPKQRVAFSNELRPDDFISIHVNSQPGKETGKGTFDIAVNSKNAMAEKSGRLASAIYRRASRPDWEQSNALAEASPYILRENGSAAALIEIGDIKNKAQMRHIEDEALLDELCSRILEGVVDAHKD